MIRDLTIEDKEWAMKVTQKVYANSVFGWEREDAENSFDAIVNDKRNLAIRGEKTLLCVFTTPRLSDYTKKDAYMELLVGEGKSGLEPLRLLQVASIWAKENGVDRLTISSVTDHRFGELLMKRLRAVPRTVYDIYY